MFTFFRRYTGAPERARKGARSDRSEYSESFRESVADNLQPSAGTSRVRGVIDTKPRELSAQEQELLKAIAEDVMEDLKRRRALDDRTPRAVAKS